MTAQLLPLQRASGSAGAAIRFDRSARFPRMSSCPSATRWISSQRWRSSSAVAPVATSAVISARIIDGKLISKQVKDEVAAEIARMKEAIGIVPGLAVILVGSRKDSQTYVRNKKKACEVVGIKSYEVNLPEDCTEEDILKQIAIFNNDPAVHGILIQLPLPRGTIICSLYPKGMYGATSQMRCWYKRQKSCCDWKEQYCWNACCITVKENASISVVHSHTKNPEEITRQADIVISAVGVANLVRGSWIKPCAVVIDVGINPVDDPESPRGYKLVGDVCYEEASKVASAITPVPGGVGPMTIAMLLSNTLESAKRVHSFK